MSITIRSANRRSAAPAIIDPERQLTDRIDEGVLLNVLSELSNGDFSVRMPLNWTGVPGKIADRLNDVIAANQILSAELARVSRVVGDEGQLSQRVVTRGSSHAWSESVESVNRLIDNLVRPTNEMQRVIGAVAGGDLSQKITADVHGEMLELKNTINSMVDQLNRFVSEVTRVAREVGTEGKLGGQAQSAEVAGVWKDLTDNVNQLAANLTNQVRAIADVATAVTEGDLTRQVGVQASGEVAVLKDKLNEMIRNLRETTRQNNEQDWLKTNLERFSRMLQGQRDLSTVSKMILSELAPLVSAQHGVFYTLVTPDEGGEAVLRYQAGYGYKERKHLATEFRLGEGLVGQCAAEKERILLTDVPGDYVMINSGLGESPPLNIIVLPILFEGAVRAVVELASFSRFSDTHRAFLDQLTETIGLVLNTIEANTLTENLLRQSQSQAQELQSRQEDLRSSNDDLAKQARRLAEQNVEVEAKNLEVEAAKRLVEEKAEQLAVSSAYKSEFFSNMSHELRTPLNSMLILSGELKANPDNNLTDSQVEYAATIHSSGSDLLRLLNDVLDLAKVESGTVKLEMSELPLTDLQDLLEREFRPIADQKGISFTVELDGDTQPTIVTDPGRLRQILKNLLANAFKFSDQGEVRMLVSQPKDGWSAENHELGQAPSVMAFTIIDTGIGIAEDQQAQIFEAFAQADGTTSRQYGGTGLGLSISRELAELLGGEITLSSTLGEGSTFTVYVPSSPSGDSAGEVGPAPAQVVMAPARPRQPMPEVLAGMKVLVVDDDFRNIFSITALLERGGMEVIPAESGEEGIALLQGMPDVSLALVDIMMPVMNGYETMRAMRKVQRETPLTIVALTARVGIGERERCNEAGASAYIPKPVEDGPDFLADLAECVITSAAEQITAGQVAAELPG